ncbi:MAG: enoyl-CoA hydratase/isomerase family protein [Chloroflexi bacterium]|nr:enoyl-CoA hydratase/isomerase family protein [Chloroflexota bacterium]
MSATDTRPEFVPATDEVLYERRDAVAIFTFNRPQARNALTWPMYEALYAACEHVDADDRVRVLVLRGAGDKAFVSGTDISQFRAFSTPQDAIEYEQNNNRYAGRLEDVRKPTIAMLRGYCVGGGAAIAMACDLRVGSPDVRFGVPIARTLGNTLSSHNLVRLVSLVGPARAKDILFTARFVDATEAKSVGLLTQIADADELETRTLQLAQTIAGHAPLTIRSTKEGINRIVKQWRLEESEDLLLMCYMSEDFKEGVEAFLAKRPANWQGR